MHHYVHHAQPTFCAWGVMDSSLPRRLADVEPQLKPKLCSFEFFLILRLIWTRMDLVLPMEAQPYTCGFPFKFSISCKSAKSRRSSIGLKKVRPWWVGVGAIGGHNPSYLRRICSPPPSLLEPAPPTASLHSSGNVQRSGRWRIRIAMDQLPVGKILFGVW